MTDSVPPDIYADYADSSPPSQSADAGVGPRKPMSTTDAGSTVRPDPDDNAEPDSDDEMEPDSEDDTEPDPTTTKDAGANPPSAEAGADNGPCDLSGRWLITQRTVEEGLGVKNTGLWWFYYELEQNGDDLTVKKGLVCGGRVVPLDLLGASVDWEPSWPAIVEKNSHAGRRAKVTVSGANCSVAFDPIYTVLGATAPYYADTSHPLPTLEEEASGDTPGWEDWDEDGKPAVSLQVSGIVNGTRNTALRNLNDWTGSTSAGAENFRLDAVPEQDQSVLGVTSDLLLTPSVASADPSLHFAQFAKLDADQAQGDDQSVCAAIRDLAPTLTREANQ